MMFKTYNDLLVAINNSKSEKGFRRLLAAEELASQVLAGKGGTSAQEAYHDSVARLVRWIDQPVSATLAERLITERVRAREEAAG